MITEILGYRKSQSINIQYKKNKELLNQHIQIIYNATARMA